MSPQSRRLQPGTRVVLKGLPPRFSSNLPLSDRRAIAEVVGRVITFVDYDDAGRAEVQFTDKRGVIHFIYVKPEFIRRAE
jgi:hypothetical protein